MTQSVTTTTIARLRDMLVHGSFAPGEHLVEATLARQLGTSRTPVRAALISAHQLGLLDYSVNRGYTVRPFNVQEFLQAHEARGLLEGAMCRSVAEAGLSVDGERRMRSTIEKVQRVLDTHAEVDGLARDRWRELNAQYHETILTNSPNAALVKLLRILQQTSLATPTVASYDRELLQTYNSQHEQILECLIRRQGQRAEYLMREHVMLSAEQMARSVTDSETPSSREETR